MQSHRARIAPAAMGLITQLVPTTKLQSTNALLGIAGNNAVAGGAALGGVLVAILEAGLPLLMAAGRANVPTLLVFCDRDVRAMTLVNKVPDVSADSPQSFFSVLRIAIFIS